MRVCRSSAVAAWLLCPALVVMACSCANAESPLLAGYVENLWISEPRISLSAKLDTGAKTSSINAPAYEIFKREGKRWVRFVLRNRKGESFNIESKLVRFVRIRRAGVKKKRRPVIRLKTCLGGKTVTRQFTLADRSRMNYQVIVGRTFLSKRFLVDSSEAFLLSGQCQSEDKP